MGEQSCPPDGIGAGRCDGSHPARRRITCCPQNLLQEWVRLDSLCGISTILWQLYFLEDMAIHSHFK